MKIANNYAITKICVQWCQFGYKDVNNLFEYIFMLWRYLMFFLFRVRVLNVFDFSKDDIPIIVDSQLQSSHPNLKTNRPSPIFSRHKGGKDVK